MEIELQTTQILYKYPLQPCHGNLNITIAMEMKVTTVLAIITALLMRHLSLSLALADHTRDLNDSSSAGFSLQLVAIPDGRPDHGVRRGSDGFLYLQRASAANLTSVLPEAYRPSAVTVQVGTGNGKREFILKHEPGTGLCAFHLAGEASASGYLSTDHFRINSGGVDPFYAFGCAHFTDKFDSKGRFAGVLAVGRAPASFLRNFVVDFGAPVTELVESAYRVVEEAVWSGLERRGAERVVEQAGYGLCVRATAAVRGRFPSLSLHFAGEDDASLVIAPEQLFLMVDDERAGAGQVACLAMVPGRRTVIGALQQVDTRFVFDLKDNKLSFAPESCVQDTVPVA
ncbi:unnamed protein product [Urochloa decumbens]|uniref:Xylanase inhibitor C-terminal domain-containing protein n=1 Tax=Urochloa decumbens TaxID=240449 RepID=A0ABC9B699_9POAL